MADMFMGVKEFNPRLQHRQIMQSEREHGREGLARSWRGSDSKQREKKEIERGRRCSMLMERGGEGQIVSRERRKRDREREKV